MNFLWAQAEVLQGGLVLGAPWVAVAQPKSVPDLGVGKVFLKKTLRARPGL